MPENEQASERRWLARQVAQYKRVFPHYERYAALLDEVLRSAAQELAPLAIIQVRSKSIASFAEKVLRKKHKYHDPVNQLTDLCGARVIARTPSEVAAISEFIKAHFEIDSDNSVDHRERLHPSEFGYRSTHYIVSFKPGADLHVKIPESLYGLKAEIQVRTTTEHAWADFGHDLSYKGAFELPVKWRRDLALIAAQLEEVDQAFGRIEEGLRTYASSYEAYMSADEIQDEIERLEIVLTYDRRNAKLASQIGKLAITLGDWEKAADVLSRYVDPDDLDSAYEPILRDLGISFCKLSENHPTGPDYLRGQRYLEKACALAPRDCDALSSLAGTWKKIDDRKARDLYLQAFEVDSTDFYPLGNFLEYELQRTKDPAILVPLKPVIEAAIRRCEAQARVGINLPWVYYGLGKLNLFMNRPSESLRAYAKAVQASTAPFMITGALESLTKLSPIRDELAGHEAARRLLLAGLAARFPSSKEATQPKKQVKELSSREYPPIESPVVIVVGGTAPSIEPRMKNYLELMREAFRDFRGTVISGGTKQGVSGLVGEVSAEYADIHSIGYLPGGRLPPDATLDRRYSEIRRTEGEIFSPLEPLQNWIDLLASGVDPKQVKVLGINGGNIAALEYRIALALGASVGVVEETGREASRLLADEQWAVADTLVALPLDPQTIRAFVGSGTSELIPEDRETIAKAIHAAHLEETAVSDQAPWEKLSEPLRDSNRLQADHIFPKLEEIGCTTCPVEGREITLMTFTNAEVERMAEMEHGRWNAERLLSRWRLGPDKSEERKISPSLVSWSELPEKAREWDRGTVRRIPAYLAGIGLEIRRER